MINFNFLDNFKWVRKRQGGHWVKTKERGWITKASFDLYVGYGFDPIYLGEEERWGEYILCSAVWYKDLPLEKPEILENRGYRPYNVDTGIVFSGWRHVNCIYAMVSLTGKRSVSAEVGESVQGFLTNKNRFVDRKEAGKIAYDAGQTKKLITYLFSEDLW